MPKSLDELCQFGGGLQHGQAYDVLNALAFCILFLPVSRVECCFYHVKEARFRGGVSLLHKKSRPVDG